MFSGKCVKQILLCSDIWLLLISKIYSWIIFFNVQHLLETFWYNYDITDWNMSVRLILLWIRFTTFDDWIIFLSDFYEQALNIKLSFNFFGVLIVIYEIFYYLRVKCNIYSFITSFVWSIFKSTDHVLNHCLFMNSRLIKIKFFNWLTETSAICGLSYGRLTSLSHP